MLSEDIREYLEASRFRGYAPATLEHFELRLEKLRRFLASRQIERSADVKPGDLDDFLTGLKQKHAAFRTQCAYVFTARLLFRWLHDKGRILVDPSRDIVLSREDDDQMPEPPLSELEVAMILDTMPRRSVTDIRNILHLELLYGCGLRLTESVTLKVSDVDLEHRCIRVLGKGGKVRVLPLMTAALNAMKDYLALRRALLKGPDDGTLLIGRWTGKPLSTMLMEQILRTIKKRLRMTRRLHAHLFRHSIAVHLLQRGADIRHVQEFLGHASIDTTKIYLRMVPGRLKDDYDKSMPDIAVMGLRSP